MYEYVLPLRLSKHRSFVALILLLIFSTVSATALGGIDCDSDDTYFRWDSDKVEGDKIEGDIDRGILIFLINRMGASELRGREMFDLMMKNFQSADSNIVAIEAHWNKEGTVSANYDSFVDAVSKGATRAEAAKSKTFTGKIAGEWQYTHVTEVVSGAEQPVRSSLPSEQESDTLIFRFRKTPYQ